MENMPLDVVVEGEKALQEGSKALTKFQEIVHDIFRGKFMMKETDANFYKYEKQANFIRDNQDLNIAFKGDDIYMFKKSPEALAIRANERMLTEAIRQESNIEDVLDLTEDELKLEENVSDEPVDEDWLCRFFGIAKDVNSYEMKFIWAKILAGEIKQPGSFSMRTMETLRNISQKEAEVFQKIFPFIMGYGGEYFTSSDDDLLNQFDIYFTDFMILSECGLVNTSLSNNPKVSESNNSYMCSDKVIIQFWGYTPEEKEINMGIHLLTCAGKELYNILEHTENTEYAVKWAETIFNQNKNKVKVLVHNILDVQDNIINHEEAPFAIFSKDIEVIQ